MFPKKNINLDVFDDVWKTQNIMLTMHISDVFRMIKNIPIFLIIFFKCKLQS